MSLVPSGVDELVEPALLDESHRGGPALLDLLLLVRVAGRRQDDAVDVARRVFERLVQRERRRARCPSR